MQKPWVCMDCGARQEAAGACHSCGHDDTLDARKEDTRELMRDIDRRLVDRREDRLRFLGVILGMGLVFGMWLIPGYWSMRGTVYPGLPLFMDQWILMAMIGLGIVKGGQRVFKAQRFPYLANDLTMT